MFEELIAKYRKATAEQSWRIAHCTDMYRLERILQMEIDTLTNLHDDATACVKELEQGK
jgi:hypothetical protein